MTRGLSLPPEVLALVAAPMVDASDLPFRLMCIRGGATLTYTQMLVPEKLTTDPVYRERAMRDLVWQKNLPQELRKPTIVQLGGRDIPAMAAAARLFSPLCEGIDINCGCPQEPIVSAGYGSALLVRKEWDHLQRLVTEIIQASSVPVSVKIRLCSPVSDTLELCKRLEALGISHITLHARFPSAKHRRHGPAKLEHVRELVEALDIPVLSNGNVRCQADLAANLAFTGAAGLMVGEELLRNPYLCSRHSVDPFELTEDYLQCCAEYPDSASMKTVKQHIKYFFEQAHLPKSWSSIVKKRIADCEDNASIGSLVSNLERTLTTIGDC